MLKESSCTDTAITPSAVASALRKSGDKVLAYEIFFVECQTLEDRDGGEKEGQCEGVELDGKFAAFDGDTLGQFLGFCRDGRLWKEPICAKTDGDLVSCGIGVNDAEKTVEIQFMTVKGVYER